MEGMPRHGDNLDATDDDAGDLGAAIALANAAREHTRVEYARLEQAMSRREASRARVIRDALATAPALAEELRLRGVLDSDSEMARLAVQIMVGGRGGGLYDTNV
jgi:hypothetical protein